MTSTIDPPQRPDPSAAPDQLPATGVEVNPASRSTPKAPAEVGGPKGPEPTRYGDWEKRGRCIDF